MAEAWRTKSVSKLYDSCVIIPLQTWQQKESVCTACTHACSCRPRGVTPVQSLTSNVQDPLQRTCLVGRKRVLRRRRLAFQIRSSPMATCAGGGRPRLLHHTAFEFVRCPDASGRICCSPSRFFVASILRCTRVHALDLKLPPAA